MSRQRVAGLTGGRPPFASGLGKRQVQVEPGVKSDRRCTPFERNIYLASRAAWEDQYNLAVLKNVDRNF
jgi:hypothetical protein